MNDCWGILPSTTISMIKHLRCSASFTADESAVYSVSVLLNATLFCFSDFEEIDLLTRRKQILCMNVGGWRHLPSRHQRSLPTATFQPDSLRFFWQIPHHMFHSHFMFPMRVLITLRQLHKWVIDNISGLDVDAIHIALWYPNGSWVT